MVICNVFNIMILRINKTKNATTYSVQKSFREPSTGKCTSKTVETLGDIEALKVRFGKEDPIGEAKKYVAKLTKEYKEDNESVMVKLSPKLLIEKGKEQSSNGGYLFLQKVYYELGLDRICKKIEKKYKNKYDLNDVLSMLLYTRILYPGSKRSSLDDASQFLDKPSIKLHQIYRALSVLAMENDMIQSAVYKNSLKLGPRKTGVLYYDCTNYFFESEQENGLRQYGYSKEHRPSPVVQMGLFMDMEGIPLAFCINPGNTNEQVTLKPLELKLGENFGLSKIVVCTDCGLSSYDNRKNNDIADRSFITVQSVKGLPEFLKNWATDTSGWSIIGRDEVVNLEEADSFGNRDTLFYKERWINERGLSQKIIVTFSFKYQHYLKMLRERQIERAKKMIEEGKGKPKKKSSNDPRRFIKELRCTPDGEEAMVTEYVLNESQIEQEERFDGFYAICTDLEDSAADVIKANSSRWRIEDCFRVMKSEFEARPVFLHRDDRIKAHFLTCFLSLLIYKYLEKKTNRGLNHFSPMEVIKTLRSMNFWDAKGEGYVPTYTRTNITNALNGSAGFRLDTQIVKPKVMRQYKRQSKDA